MLDNIDWSNPIKAIQTWLRMYPEYAEKIYIAVTILLLIALAGWARNRWRR